MLNIPRSFVTPETTSNITEAMLFDEPYRSSEYSVEEIKTEILCLKRLLRCTLKFLSFKQLRQLVLRRLLRFIKDVMPHPSCEDIFEDCIDAVKEFYMRLNFKKEANLKTARIANSFLKVLSLTPIDGSKKKGDKERAKAVRQLQEDAFAFWGLHLFEDMDVNATNESNNLSLSMAEAQSEKGQQHAHSLWIYLQHQQHWECIFNDDEMKKFRQEYDKFAKDTKRIQLSMRVALKKFLTLCGQVFEEMKLCIIKPF
ncbi:hypothetical protein RFI_08139 [Reticulomyxa filosa]|uniref:Uncharacterized protein n=1 Tax=Reticulomyxa filosa TaxID=46433 RepID=X6NSL6_RETFI|nr:hypothetical protein RFI_08139 [Reticulomyxa filosa]|eukprot:ETO28986.1 hypothetical protein RFI_08139 [Reticulomyxa filosa]